MHAGIAEASFGPGAPFATTDTLSDTKPQFALTLAEREAVAASALAAMDVYGSVEHMCAAQAMVLSLHGEALADAAEGYKRTADWQASEQPDAKRAASTVAPAGGPATMDWPAQQQQYNAYAAYYQQQGQYNYNYGY
jgi:hypothetical protein